MRVVFLCVSFLSHLLFLALDIDFTGDITRRRDGGCGYYVEEEGKEKEEKLEKNEK